MIGPTIIFTKNEISVSSTFSKSIVQTL